MKDSLENWIILTGDCKETLKSIRSDSIDLIVSSPPYGLDKKYGNTSEKKQSLEDYLTDMRPALIELCRILKTTGSLCWQVGNHIQGSEVVPLDTHFYHLFKELGLSLRNRIVWRFEHGLHSSKTFIGSAMRLSCGSRSPMPTYFNLDSVRVPQKYPGKTHFKGLNYGLPSSNPLGKNPSDYWDIGLIEEDWRNWFGTFQTSKTTMSKKRSIPVSSLSN